MSGKTGQRYWTHTLITDEQRGQCKMALSKVVLASDYNTLRTQARELAHALKENRRELCPFVYGSPQESVWLQTDREHQLALAVLDATKEGV